MCHRKSLQRPLPKALERLRPLYLGVPARNDGDRTEQEDREPGPLTLRPHPPRPDPSQLKAQPRVQGPLPLPTVNGKGKKLKEHRPQLTPRIQEGNRNAQEGRAAHALCVQAMADR